MERKTYRIDSVEGKEPLATGYKIFNWDWTGADNYCYADENGNVEGTIHTVDGALSACAWGLHFCKNPIDCMKFYAPVQWMRYAKVTAFDEIKEGDDGKTVARTLRIDKLMTWDEYVEACKTVPQKLAEQDATSATNCEGVANISGGSDIYGGHGINGGRYISGGSDIFGGNSIFGGSDIYGGHGINGGCGIYGGRYIYGGGYISGGRYIYGGNNIFGGSDIYGGRYISGGGYIYGGNSIYGGSYISGGCKLQYCANLEGASRCIFCHDLEGVKLHLFNKPVSEKRYSDVKSRITKLADGWYPNFTNAQELRDKSDGKEWKATPADRISYRTAKEAYADMPEKLREYIKNLPEYDEAIFKAITEGENG